MITLRTTTTDDPAFRELEREQVADVMRRYSSDDPGPAVHGGLPAVVAERRATDARADAGATAHGPVPLGCIALSPLGETGATEAGTDEWRESEIKRVYVRETARGQGVARRLLAAMEELARERGTHILKLEVGQMQPEAVALYTSEGWERTDCYGYWKDEPLVICMRKRLHPRPDAEVPASA
ncbi:GNAT family N-acetyltransferase [Herbiconiux sp. CPCC 205716]|uniref:GNAT family N-acetyltransferase n=1 Tax=Herbiconiux gentiana TaxID=2970912 RepID=A0ABT2GIB1_9MICO|nr:GNAT family N-acetyltransferase [Herbiconiux gentiana]MCS5715337.1 GNAT family N-acetyltransferase [Herbiconiux gentiana]